ncbi:hypothetical protein T484DRAFT_2256436 [Baffinella frigidus]|nr:hypothetical protein T484DRAFT_2256436 [Cryptophyta sp. CCMP2293]
MADESVLIQQQLDHEMERLFQHFEQDEERTARLAAALEQESTAAALHFALFPRKTRDGGLQPTCREPVVSMMAFVVDIFSPHDGSVDLRVLAECFTPTADGSGGAGAGGDDAANRPAEGIVGLSYQYKDEGGNMVHISRGKVRTPCDSSCARFPGTVSPCPLDLVVGERDVSSRATVDREGRTYAEPRFESPLRRGSDSLLHIARCCNLCSRCTLRRDASLSTA